MCCVVEKMEDRINTANHMVAINRTRCILMEIEITVVFLVSIVTAWPGWE